MYVCMYARHRAAAWLLAGGVAIGWYELDKRKAKEAATAVTFSPEEQQMWNTSVKRHTDAAAKSTESNADK